MPPITTKSEANSRYGNKIATKCEASLQPDEVAGLLNKLRSNFNAEKTMSKDWRMAQLRAFGRLLKEGEKELCEAMKKDLHKSHFEGKVIELDMIQGELDNAIEHLDQWMKPTKKPNSPLNMPAWSTTQRDPLGVVLIMGAWNYPMQLSLLPIIGAIAAGNCVVLKPGSYAVACSNTMTKLINKYMDPDCIVAVEGNRQITTALLNEKFDKIMFTGSGFVGKIVATAAAKHLTPCVLELGGKSPCIVDNTADLEHAAERLIWGSFTNAGQTCIRPDFLMVHKDVAEGLFREMKKAVIKFYTAEVHKTEYFGRCINDVAYQRLAKLMDDSKEFLIHGGQNKAEEKYIEPSIYDYGTDIKLFAESPLMQDETFGPLLPCVRYSDVEEVIGFVKALPTGKPLALYAFSKDPKFISAIKTRTTSGGLCINDTLMHVATHFLPFGGVGNSGLGSYHGKYSFDTFTHEKAVLEKSQTLDQLFFVKPALQARFPPYTPLKRLIIKLATMPVAEKIGNSAMPAMRALFKFICAYILFSLLGFKIVRE